MTQPAAAPAAPAAPAASPAPEPMGGVTKPTTSKPADAKTAQTPPKDSTPTEKIRVRGYERAAKVKEKLDGESSTSDSAGEPSTPTPPTSRGSSAESGGEERAAKPPPAPSHDVDLRAKHAEERLKRIAEVARKEREADAEREQKRAGRVSEQEVEKLRKRVAELEPMNEVFASEEALLAAAEAKGMSAEKLVAWMRTRLSDPTAVAQRQAKTVEEKLRAEMAELRAQVARQEQERREEQARYAEQHAAIQRAQTFEKIATERAESHPLTARLLKRQGMDAVARFANEQILQYLPDSFSPEHLHDVMEQYLEWLHGGDAATPANPAPGASHPQAKNGAEKPVTTLSNALVAERMSVTEETPLHHLPLPERKRRLKAKLERE